MTADAHLEDTRMPAEHDEDAEEESIMIGQKGNHEDCRYDALRYWTYGEIDWDAEEW